MGVVGRGAMGRADEPVVLLPEGLVRGDCRARCDERINPRCRCSDEHK